jgi:hypothetical protein
MSAHPATSACSSRSCRGGAVFVCAPYRESRDRLTRGHINVFDDDFLTSLNADEIELVESPAWGQFLAPRYKMFIARLPGHAHRSSTAQVPRPAA